MAQSVRRLSEIMFRRHDPERKTRWHTRRMSTPSQGITFHLRSSGRPSSSPGPSCTIRSGSTARSRSSIAGSRRGGETSPASSAPREALTYRQLQERVNRICNVLVGTLGFVAGNRVLLRSANNPMMVALYLAVLKAGGAVVATMPLLRAKEIAYPLNKAKITLAFCDHRLSDEMERARALAPGSQACRLLGSLEHRRLKALIAGASTEFDAAGHGSRRRLPHRLHPPAPRASRRAPCAFPSRHAGDLRRLCRQRPAGAAERPLRRLAAGAFTFGLGGIVLFPLHIGASTVLLEKAGPTSSCWAPSRSTRQRSASHRAHRLPRHAGQARRP